MSVDKWAFWVEFNAVWSSAIVFQQPVGKDLIAATCLLGMLDRLTPYVFPLFEPFFVLIDSVLEKLVLSRWSCRSHILFFNWSSQGFNLRYLLDIRTLSFASGIISPIHSIGMLHVSRSRKPYNGFAQWTIALFTNSFLANFSHETKAILFCDQVEHPAF